MSTLEAVAGAGGLRAFQDAFLGDLGGREPKTSEERALVFRAPPRGSVDERWGIYAGAYVARIAEALENDCPALRRIVGEGPFRSLAASYVAACPPRSFDLGLSGDHLAAFLESDPLAAELPFLPDLARLEWAAAEAFVAPDAAPLSWEDLEGAGPEAVADLLLSLLPGTAVVRSRWPLLDLRALRDVPDEEVSLAVDGRPQTVLVHRHGLHVRCRLASEDEAQLVESLSRPSSLAGLQALGLLDGDVSRLVSCFRRLAAEGVFRSPSPHQ